MSKPHDNLTLKAAALARAAPDNWREFVLALSDFSEVHTQNLVMSQLPELPVNQGRAQMLSIVLGLMSNCVSNADRIKKD